jgi:O-antigen ligase
VSSHVKNKRKQWALDSKEGLREKRLGKQILVVCILVTIVITPSLTVDPFNPPKFLILTLGVCVLSVRNWKLILTHLRESRLAITLYTFIIVCCIVLISNIYSFSERIFGHEGRNFGFIIVFSLGILGIYSYVATRNRFLVPLSLFKSLALTNLVVVIVFFLQQRGLAFTQFDNLYGVLPSTLGNPNFLSSFVAISIIGTLGWILNSQTRNYLRLAGISQIFISLYLILQTGSIQGFVALSIVLILYFVSLIRNFFSIKIYKIIFVALLIFFLSLLFSNIRSSFVSFFNTQETLLNRFVYWKIGLEMFQESPIVGMGFDAYLDNFRRYLTSKNRNTIGQGTVSDSPHNIYLDYFVSGGLMLGGIFVFFIFLTLNRLKIFLLRAETRTFKPLESDLLVFLFLSYLAIAFISPFNIGLFVWLPVMMGMIVGSEKSLRSGYLLRMDELLSSKFKEICARGLLLLILLSCNPFFASLPAITEVRFRGAVESGDFFKLKSVALDWPYSGGRAISIAQGMLDASFAQSSSPDNLAQSQLQLVKETAIQIAEASTKINVKHFESWKFLYANSDDKFMKSNSLKILKQLDPYNSNWVN